MATKAYAIPLDKILSFGRVSPLLYPGSLLGLCRDYHDILMGLQGVVKEFVFSWDLHTKRRILFANKFCKDTDGARMMLQVITVHK